ncbi:MAG TPA: stage 0 sporulation family protein [Candidatus Caccopulliclostridium gallistercoris]|uniref:Stage 0 sporulation family protein n=1 Tax=Candidatus Caccopulliclostridium gallistercoris TaxID=2840719 RepID=A0A9D1SYS2_9FIRM|nr:stage 0 sporulation family protein [Candidatus Caccopulliclostridium gallistercoris]
MQIKEVGINFEGQPKIYSFNPAGLNLKLGDYVVVDTARGLELGKVATPIKEEEVKEGNEPLKKVIRLATEEDIKAKGNNVLEAKKDKTRIIEIVNDFKLDMKIVSVELTLDKSKMLINFTSENRVDFRELVKTLASEFKTRIELRQIGPRDEVKILGGLGPCGRPCCCTKNTGDFEHVSIKMAKNQGLSLNPSNISGLCGRLMCCLSYENKHYAEALKLMPKVGSEVKTPDGVGTVLYNNLLKRTVEVKFEDDKKEYAVSELEFNKITQNEDLED